MKAFRILVIVSVLVVGLVSPAYSQPSSGAETACTYELIVDLDYRPGYVTYVLLFWTSTRYPLLATIGFSVHPDTEIVYMQPAHPFAYIDGPTTWWPYATIWPGEYIPTMFVVQTTLPPAGGPATTSQRIHGCSR